MTMLAAVLVWLGASHTCQVSASNSRPPDRRMRRRDDLVKATAEQVPVEREGLVCKLDGNSFGKWRCGLVQLMQAAYPLVANAEYVCEVLLQAPADTRPKWRLTRRLNRFALLQRSPWYHICWNSARRTSFGFGSGSGVNPRSNSKAKCRRTIASIASSGRKHDRPSAPHDTFSSSAIMPYQ